MPLLLSCHTKAGPNLTCLQARSCLQSEKTCLQIWNSVLGQLCPVVHFKRKSNYFCDNFFAIISTHVDVADKLSGSELKSGVWVGV